MSIASEGHSNQLTQGELYRSRFLVARTEEHLRELVAETAGASTTVGAETREAFLRSSRLSFRKPGFEALAHQFEELRNTALLETVPAEDQDVWAGNLLSRLRGENIRRLSEIWVASTYHGRHALVRLNHLFAVPLQDALEEPLNFTVKYLDCREPLSIQVHPDEQTAKHLWSAPLFSVMDNRGKDETFYVLDHSTDDFQIYLGFDRHKLRRMAAIIRSELRRLMYTPKLTWMDVCEHIVKAIISASRKEVEERIQELKKRKRKPEEQRKIGERAKDEEKTEEVLALVQSDLDVANKVNGGEGDNKDGSPDKPDALKSLRLAVDYQLNKGLNRDRPTGDFSSEHAHSLRGKEFIFAGVAVIHMAYQFQLSILEAEEESKKKTKEEGDAKAKEKLAKRVERTFKLPSCHDGFFLHYLHKRALRKNDWISIPAGTVHSLQGGGNLLVEIANTSDNTFRIFDFGRELYESTRRDLHFAEAMFSITPRGIFEEAGLNRLIVNRDDPRLSSDKKAGEAEKKDRKLAKRDRHCAVEVYDVNDEARFDNQSEKPSPTCTIQKDKHKDKTFAIECVANTVILNPDDPLRVTCEEPARQKHIGSLRSLIVKVKKPDEPERTIAGKLSVQTRYPGDQVLCITPKQLAEVRLCVGLGATKLEIAVWRRDIVNRFRWKSLEFNAQAGQEDLIHTIVNGTHQLLFGVDDLKGLIAKDTGNLSQLQLRVGISWPGHRRPQTDESGDRGTDRFVTSHPVGLSDYTFRAALRERLDHALKNKGLPNSSTTVELQADAEISVLGERWHPLGRFGDGNPGMLLDLASGVCAGFYLGDEIESAVAMTGAEGQEHNHEEKWSEQEKRQIRRIRPAVGAVGRWLYVNYRTGQIAPYVDAALRPNYKGSWLRSTPDELADKLSEAVFSAGEKRDQCIYDDNWLRLSSYLSNRGIGIRFLSRLRSKVPDVYEAFEDHLGAGWNGFLNHLTKKEPIDRFLEAVRLLAENPKEFPRPPLYWAINELAKAPITDDNLDWLGIEEDTTRDELKRVARNFVVEVASEIVAVIREIAQMMDRLLPQDHTNGRLTGCTRRVVLTGIVGDQFGQVDVGRVGSDETHSDDLLLHVINRCMRPRSKMDGVFRSEIDVACERELAGFLGHGRL